jgi:pimeloyl-ACP methyl ester carboxylesterase
MMERIRISCLLAALLLLPDRAQPDDNPQSELAQEIADRLEKIPMKTLGGRQLWADVLHFHDWRIQQCHLDGHYRLLDGDDARHASGTLEECRGRLEEIRKDRQLPAMKGKAVILVHGIVRSSKSFHRMSSVLRDAGYHVIGFDYPSTRIEIPASAEYLHQVVESLEGIEEINFVVHSMGGLVVRAYLKEHRDPRIKRMVMLGVPNQGARMASLLEKNVLYRALYGPAGQQLVDDPNGLIAALPTPDFEFALIAGIRGNEQGYNPLITGDDDGTISLECTRLPGAADTLCVTAMHSFLMNNPEVIAATQQFLNTGALRETGDKQPLPREPGPASAAATATQDHQ